MVTLALAQEGWEVESSGSAWARWRLGEKLIYVEGWLRGSRRIVFGGTDGVSQEELDALAERLIKASGLWLALDAS